MKTDKTDVDRFPTYARKKASTPQLKKLFSMLSKRTVVMAELQHDLLLTIIEDREKLERKPFKLKRHEETEIAEFDKDSVNARDKLRKLIPSMDDRSLLGVSLVGECNQLHWEEHIVMKYSIAVQPLAQKIIQYRHGTIDLIENYIESSPYKGDIVRPENIHLRKT